MGQQKLAALGQPHQPCPADVAVASVSAAATTAVATTAAAGEADTILNHVMPKRVTFWLGSCSCMLFAAVPAWHALSAVLACIGIHTFLLKR